MPREPIWVDAIWVDAIWVDAIWVDAIWVDAMWMDPCGPTCDRRVRQAFNEVSVRTPARTPEPEGS
jgi:hypothetical protein